MGHRLGAAGGIGEHRVGNANARFFFCFFFLAAPQPCGILVPRSGIQPEAPAVEVPSPKQWTTRKFPVLTHVNAFLCESEVTPKSIKFIPPPPEGPTHLLGISPTPAWESSLFKMSNYFKGVHWNQEMFPPSGP